MANTIKMEINIDAVSLQHAIDTVQSTIREAEPEAKVIIVQCFEEVYNNNETIVLPEDM
jgi:hypothetical protein